MPPVAGKTVLNINFIAGEVAVHSALDQTKPEKIITSKEFMRRMEGRMTMLPGIAIRIVDPETMKKLSPNEDGLVIIGGA